MTKSKHDNHGHCGHHHEHDHGHCGHHHDHNHEHCCHHHHHEHEEPMVRHAYSAEELALFEKEPAERLMTLFDGLLDENKFEKALPIMEIAYKKLADNSPEKQELEIQLAYSYDIFQEFEHSKIFWEKVIAKLETQEDPTELLDAYLAASGNARNLENEALFLEYLEKGLALAKKANLEEYEGTFEFEFGFYYSDLDEFEKAEKSLLAAQKIQESMQNEEDLFHTLCELGRIYDAQSKIEQAQKHYEAALLISKKEEFREEFQEDRQELESLLAEIKKNNLKQKLSGF